MKSILLTIAYMVIGMEVMACAAAPTPLELPPPPPAIKPVCADKVLLLDEDALKKGTACSENARLIFPLYYQPQGKVLILCQCK